MCYLSRNPLWTPYRSVKILLARLKNLYTTAYLNFNYSTSKE